MKLYMFRTVRLSIIRSLFTVHPAMVYVIQVCRQLSSRSICSCTTAVKLVHLVGFITKKHIIPVCTNLFTAPGHHQLQRLPDLQHSKLSQLNMLLTKQHYHARPRRWLLLISVSEYLTCETLE